MRVAICVAFILFVWLFVYGCPAMNQVFEREAQESYAAQQQRSLDALAVCRRMKGHPVVKPDPYNHGLWIVVSCTLE